MMPELDWALSIEGGLRNNNPAITDKAENPRFKPRLRSNLPPRSQSANWIPSSCFLSLPIASSDCTPLVAEFAFLVEVGKRFSCHPPPYPFCASVHSKAT